MDDVNPNSADFLQASRPPKMRSALFNRRILTVITLLATLMQTVDSTIANVALPYMQGSMAASQEQINWVLTSYIIASAIFTAPIGFLASRFGRTRLFLFSTIGFTFASILCGLSNTLTEIVLFRFLQGLCGAMLVPLSQSVLLEIYSIEQRGSAMALWGMGVQAGPIIGPLLGGWLTAQLSWRWVFYVNLPFGILASLGLIFFLKETPHSRSVKLDWIGFTSLAISVSALQALLDRGETLDWFNSPEIIIEASAAALFFYLYLVQSTLAPRPLFNPRVFKDANFLIGTIIGAIVTGSVYATLALLAPYLQTLMNYPVVTAGEVLAPRGLGAMGAMLLGGQLLRYIPSRWLLAAGFAGLITALYQVIGWTPDVSPWTIILAGVVQGVGLGFTFLSLTTITFTTLAPELRNEAAGVSSLIRNMGSAIGISVTGALLAINTQVNHAILSADVTPFARALQNGGPQRFWNPEHAHGAMLLNDEVTRQATVIAYVDNFKLMLVVMVIMVPTLLMVKSPPLPRTARLANRDKPHGASRTEPG